MKTAHRALPLVVCSLWMLSGGAAAAKEPAAPPEVSLDVGWDSTWAMLFGLENIFQNSTILQGYGGGVSIQRNLDATTGIRGSVGITRTTNPAYVVTQTTVSGGTTTTNQTFVAPGGPTSTFGLTLSATYLKRFTTGALSAYAGGGLAFGYASTSRSFSDTVTVQDQTTTVNDGSNTFGFGLQGVLGVDWRIAKSFSLFAEYGLAITPFSQSSANTSTTITNAAGTITDTSSYSQRHAFSLSTGLAQGGTLGLIAFF